MWNLAGQRGCRLRFGVVICLGEFVIDLLQEPILTPSLSHSRPDERPLSPKFRAIQSESHDAFRERSSNVGSCGSDHLKFAEVPHDDFARAIVPFREGSLEQEVVERVVLNMNREAHYLGVFAWPFRHRPRDEDPADFQAEVVVEIPGPVFLNGESGSRGSGPRLRFGDGWGAHADDREGPHVCALLDSSYCSSPRLPKILSSELPSPVPPRDWLRVVHPLLLGNRGALGGRSLLCPSAGRDEELDPDAIRVLDVRPAMDRVFHL